MSISILADAKQNSFDPRRLSAAVLFLLAGYLIAVAYLLFNGKTLIALMALTAPVALVIASQPRLTLFTFLFMLFIRYDVLPTVPVTVADLGVGLLVLSALLDILLDPSQPRPLPPLFGNYVALLLALIVCSIAGYGLAISLHPLARVSLLFATFLAAYRLSAKTDVSTLLKFFFWNTVVHSVIALVPFLASGGRIRSFGLLSVALDDYAMLALPLGVAFYLWSRRAIATHYLFGSAMITLALIGTQSRAPIFFALCGAAVVLVVSWRRSMKWKAEGLNDPNPSQRSGIPPVSARIRTLLLFGLGSALPILALKPDYLLKALERFQWLFTTQPGETFRLRVELWGTAFRTFVDHPLTGIGPGLFRSIGDVYPTLHLKTLNYYVHGLSAHNLLLHYLAETGLVGTTMLVALFVNQYRLARRSWRFAKRGACDGSQVGLFALAALFLGTTFIEGGWMWGEWGLLAALLFALMARSAWLSSGSKTSVIRN